MNLDINEDSGSPLHPPHGKKKRSWMQSEKKGAEIDNTD